MIVMLPLKVLLPLKISGLAPILVKPLGPTMLPEINVVL